MAPSRVARLFAALFACALPVFGGTLYVPTVVPDGPPGHEYQTRIWLTNHGSQVATVTTVRLRGVGDGTTDRDPPQQHRIAPGATKVLTPGPLPGMVEIQAPDGVAVEAEIRDLALPARQEVFGTVPVIGSESSAPAGGTLVLQGMRRTPFGVRTLLGVINLGHAPAECDVEMTSPAGVRLGAADGILVPPLSHLPVADVLELVDVPQMADANARVSCSQRFYAYLALSAEATGGTIFVEPSATGASTLEPPGAATPPPPPPASGGDGGGKAFVFTRNGLVHSPTRSHPTWTHDIQAPPNTDFGKIVVEVDVTPGAWDRKEPNKAHSVFWLHRGGTWPTWAGNMIGYANAHGPGSNQVRVAHNMNVPGRPYPSVRGKAKLERGKTYRVRYVYDAAGDRITIRVSRGGTVLSTGTSKARVRKIRSDATGKFMLYFGHEKYDGPGKAGPEKPTYGWKYSNVRVEFHPL